MTTVVFPVVVSVDPLQIRPLSLNVSSKAPLPDQHPPLHIRCLIVHAEISADVLDRHSSEWLKLLSGTFPDVQQRKDWTLEILGTEEMLKPRVKLSLTPVQERRDTSKRLTADMTTFPDRIMLRLQRQDGYLGSYEELKQLAEEFFPSWMKIFGIHKLKGFELIYVNLLSKTYTPKSVTEKDGTFSIDVGATLTMFSSVPGQYHDLRSPYRAEITTNVGQTSLFTFSVNDIPSGKMMGAPDEAGIQVTLKYQDMPSTGLDFPSLLNEIDTGHNVLLDQFRYFFTEQSRNLFK
jgi:hypothetical protein